MPALPVNAITTASNQMRLEAERVRTIATNIANATVGGYKREMFMATHMTPLLDSTLAVPDSSAAVRGSAVRDFRQGAVRKSGAPLDLAIVGDAFLELVTPGGPAYVRGGALSVNAAGVLVGPKDWPVMGKNGPITLSTDAPDIDASGLIAELGAPVGQLKLVRFDAASLGRLVVDGDGVWRGVGMAELPVERDVRVLQGHIEASNVDPVSEMVGLLTTLRQMEGAQRVIKAYDEMLEKSIRKLGDI